MNTLPIQMPNAMNVSMESAPKSRGAEPTNSESSFRQVLKDEMAERRPNGAEVSPSVAKTDKSTQPAQAKESSKSAESSQDKEETVQAATEARPEDMAQYLALTSQFATPISSPDAAARTDAAALASTVPGEAPAALDVANHAGLPVQGAVTEQTQLQHGKGAARDTQGASEKDFSNVLGETRQMQQPVDAAAEKTAKTGFAGAESLASARQGAEKAADIQQPGAQAASIAALQHSSVEKLQGHFDPSSDRIAARVATPAWNHAVGQKVVWMANNDQQSAALTLNPPDLGPLQVVISVTESTATANFVSAHPEVRQALENAMPRLREMLGEAGIQLGQAHVGAGNPNDNGAWMPQQQAQTFSGSGDSAPSSVTTTPVPTQAIRRGLVDTFA